MRDGARFLDVFLRGSEPSALLLGAFGLGLTFVGIASNLLYELARDGSVEPAAGRRVAMALLFLLIAANTFYQLDLRRRGVRAVVREGALQGRYDHLVCLLDPSAEAREPLMAAIHHHQQAGGARDVWLLYYPSEEMEAAYQAVAQAVAQRGLPMHLRPVPLLAPTAGAVYKAAQQVFAEASAERAAPLLCDITGGTKLLTAGLVLAALAEGYPMACAASDEDGGGEPMSLPRIVQVDVSFYARREEPRQG